MAVFAIISVTIVGSTMSTLAATSSARALVQAQAAAEAGIDSTVNALAKDICATPIPSPVEPIFKVDVLYQNPAGTWTDKCANAQKIKLTSTGTAANAGISAASAENRRKVEAVYPLHVKSATLPQTYPAVYSWSDFTIDKALVTSTDPDLTPVIQVGNGAAACTKFDNKELFTVNMFATKGISCEGSGGRYPNSTVPEWVNVGYDKTDWVGFTEVKPATCSVPAVKKIINEANTGTKTLLDARACDILQLNGNDKEGSSEKKIDWKLTGDLAIFAPGFETDKWFRVATDLEAVNLWLITPDNRLDNSGRPSCSGKNSKYMKTIIDEPITGMIYTPCELELANKAFWRGGVYAGKVKIVDNNTELQYAPVRVPWDEQAAVESGGASYLGDRVSIRDVD